MASFSTKSSFRTSKAQSHQSPNKTNRSPSMSSHHAMVELKHRIIASLSKLSDRDTHQIGVDDLEKTISTLPSDGFSMVLNSLLHDTPTSVDPSTRQPPTTAKREYLRLLAFLCSSHPEQASAHLPKIISHVVRRVKDPSSDTSVRDACRDAIGSLSGLYLGTINDPTVENYSSVVALFVKPLFEAMTEQNRGVQAGAALCLAKVVECAVGEEGNNEERSNAVGFAFQKLLPRICKLLGGQNFQSKAALLSVVSSLSQVGAITHHGMQSLLQVIRECMENSDWAARKAAADALSVLASTSTHLIGDGVVSTLAAIEACRFDKVKPVRDSMTEALGLWKKIGGNEEDNALEERKSLFNDNKDTGTTDPVEKCSDSTDKASDSAPKKSSGGSSPIVSPVSEAKHSGIQEKAANILKKKLPALHDKELNSKFFQKLETRSSDDLPVEVVLPCKDQHLQGEIKHESNNGNAQGISSSDNACPPCRDSNDNRGPGINTRRRSGGLVKTQAMNEFARDRLAEQRHFEGNDSKLRCWDSDKTLDTDQKDCVVPFGTSRADNHSESSVIGNKGNLLTIQRQLLQLERQQANLMNMLQDFMGGSHDSMVTLENRVRGLERVVEEMARDLGVSVRRSTNMVMGYEGSPGRASTNFNGYSDNSKSKYLRAGEGRMPYAERYLASNGLVSGMRGRDPQRRSGNELWEAYAYAAPRYGPFTRRRGFVSSSTDGRLSRTEHDGESGNRRGWEKGSGDSGPFRLGEGPSARSVWQASKDESTLDAIRVAGEDNGTQRTPPKKAIAELDGEALTDDNIGQERGPLWTSWTHAMDSLYEGDVDSAYAEILYSGDDLLLLKLMDQTGPLVDQLSKEIAREVLHAVAQFLLEQSLQDIALAWIQQLTELVVENGPGHLGMNMESKKEILLGLHHASTVEPLEEWEGATAEQLMMQLSSSWEINIHQIVK